MSKLPPVKYSQQFMQRPNQEPDDSISPDQKVITAYKDLNKDVDLHLQKQRQQLYFAFGIIVVLGIGILISQSTHKPQRSVASTYDEFQVEGTATSTEHYQYDKSCYEGKNGEQICMTRESKKK